MKTSTILLVTGAVVATVYFFGKQGKTAAQGASQAAVPDTAPVVHLVEETLHQHEGEDNPIVHAFEEAVAQKHEAAGA